MGNENDRPAGRPGGLADSGVAYVPAFELPPSVYMSESARRLFAGRGDWMPDVRPGDSIAEYRAAMDRHFYAPRLQRMLAQFPATIESQRIAGVRVDLVTPSSGRGTRQDRILINLHGGGFRVGAGMGALLESIPAAAKAGLQVITVDYRQGPEHEFPAASEDVSAVYHALLERYHARNIGIFGVSAGGVLSAMSIAWFEKENLPQPGAVALLCAPADNIWGGDSRFSTPALFGHPAPPPTPNPPPTGMPYVRMEDLTNPLVSPAVSAELLAKFPPTFLATGTRAGEFSAVANSHARLVKAGTLAELHVWDGMWHGFMLEPDLEEAEEAWTLLARFWSRHLAA